MSLKVPKWYLKCRPRWTSHLPYVFTEHGAIMAANVLKSRRAVQMSVFVVRAFLKMRALFGDKGDLAQKLASLEKELKQRLDVHEAVIVTILQRVMDVIDPPMIQEAPKPQIVSIPGPGLCRRCYWGAWCRRVERRRFR